MFVDKKSALFCHHPLLNVAFLILLSFFVAYLEVQIEGTHGWAASLPTWRQKVGSSSFVLTGYHVAFWSTLLLMVHLPFLMVPWSGRLECFVLSFLFALLLLEDAMWFFMNRRVHDDPWRQPKVFNTVPYFFFLAASIAVATAYFTRCRSWFISICGLMILVLISYPFQIPTSS
jgi:hypothetical protein